MATAFNSQGAVPQTSQLPGLGGGGNFAAPSSTSFSKALNVAQSPVNWSALTVAPANSSTANAKSQTVQHPDGTKITTNYDTSGTGTTAGMIPATQPTYSGGTNAQGQGIGSIIPSGASQTQTTTQIPTSSQTTPTGGSSAPTATYPGILNSLAQTSAQGSPTGQAITNALQSTSAASSPAATAAQQATAQAGLLNPALAANAANAANQYAPMAQNAITNAAPELTGFATGGGGPIGLGRAGAVQNTLSNYLQGLQSAENLSLNPNAQELTAAQQQASAEEAAGNLANTQQANIQSGETSAGNLANTAQANVQSGLTSAGQLAQPSSAGFPFTYDPTTNSFAVSGGNLQGAISGGVQQSLSNPALYTALNNAISSTYGTAAAGMFQQAYITAGGNPNIAAGQAAGQTAGTTAVAAAGGQAQAQNQIAVGTAPVQAQLGVYNQQLANLGTSQVAAQQIGAFGDQLIATMSAPPEQGGLGINPYSSQYANEKLNQIQTQFNDPKYATFNTNIAGLQARVSSLLQTGEIPTAATAGAQAIVSGNATLASMQATLQQIQAEAGAITGSQAQVASTAYQQAQQSAGVGNQAQNSVSIPLSTGGNATFVKNAQGIWVVQ